MFLMTSCVTSARELAAEASLHHSFALVSHACSITVSSAGCRFTRGLAVSTTSHSSRKELIVLGHYHSAGAEDDCSSHRAYPLYCGLSIFVIFPVSVVCLYFYRREA